MLGRAIDNIQCGTTHYSNTNRTSTATVIFQFLAVKIKSYILCYKKHACFFFTPAGIKIRVIGKGNIIHKFYSATLSCSITESRNVGYVVHIIFDKLAVALNSLNCVSKRAGLFLMLVTGGLGKLNLYIEDDIRTTGEHCACGGRYCRCGSIVKSKHGGNILCRLLINGDLESVKEAFVTRGLCKYGLIFDRYITGVMNCNSECDKVTGNHLIDSDNIARKGCRGLGQCLAEVRTKNKAGGCSGNADLTGGNSYVYLAGAGEQREGGARDQADAQRDREDG